MPRLIEHIDAIARKKQRDVLYISFNSVAEPKGPGGILHEFDEDAKSWKCFVHRQALIDWLDQNGFEWQMCGPVCRPHVVEPYAGDIYIDVPFDTKDKKFLQLQEHLENPDGAMRQEGIDFCYLPLDHAMQNAHHDHPDFWKNNGIS